MPLWHKFGMTLADYMRDQKINDAALAAQIGVSRPYVTRIRKGERRPSLDVAAKLEAVTGIPAVSFAETQAKAVPAPGKSRKGRPAKRDGVQ